MPIAWSNPVFAIKCKPFSTSPFLRSRYPSGVIPSGALSGFVADSGFSVVDNGDGTWTISDAQSRFGSKPNGGPPVWLFDLGNDPSGDSSALGRKSILGSAMWAQNGAPSNSVTTVVKPGSQYSRTIDSDDPRTYNTPMAHLPFDGNTGRKWMYYVDWYNNWTLSEVRASNLETRSAGDYGHINCKWRRFQHDSAQTGPYMNNAFQGNTYRTVFSGDGSDPYEHGYNIDNYYDQKKWWGEEQIVRVSSGVGITDAYSGVFVNGKSASYKDNVDSHKGYDPVAYNWTYFKLHAFAEWAKMGVAPMHFDLIYVDDSWCRVFISDSSVWDTSVEFAREIQIPKTWVPGGIDMQFRQGSFTSLSGKYLWAIGDDNTPHRVGGWT